MKNKIILLITILLSTNAGYTMPASAHEVMIKFSIAMIGVLASTVAIFVGLSIYNKIRNNLGINLSPEEEILKTPKTKDEAIKFFIRKNKIK